MSDQLIDADESGALGCRSEAEIRELMGMFDVPSFARRGQALEFTLGRLHDRCRARRLELLDMVRMRLKQWARAADGPDAWRGVFAAPIDGLWTLSQADPPAWTESLQSVRRRRAIAADLAAAVARFNARWNRYIHDLEINSINLMIQQYNQFYVLEKECVLGSARLAARFFRPEPLISPERLLEMHPLLPVVEPA